MCQHVAFNQQALAADALKNRVSDDQRLKLEGVLETDYYAKQTSSGGPIKVIGIVVAVIMAIGSSFAAMNTMYAIVSQRTREIGTLRALGFSRCSVSWLLTVFVGMATLYLNVKFLQLCTQLLRVLVVNHVHSESPRALEVQRPVIDKDALAGRTLRNF